MARKSTELISAVRDDITITAPAVIAADTDAGRAWTMDQALASYKRLRVRLLEYLEGQKEKE